MTGSSLLADSSIIQGTRLAVPRILVDLHQTEQMIIEVNFKHMGSTLSSR